MGKHSIKTMERKIPVTMETDFIYFYGLISNSSPWAKLPLTSDAKRLCSFREHCAAWGSISCLFGEDRGRAGWLNKETKYIRISLKKIDSNQSSQLIGVRRLYSEFITSREKCSPLIVNSLISIVKEM